MAEALQRLESTHFFPFFFFKREGKEKYFISQPAKLNSKKNPLTVLANIYRSNAKKL